MHERVNGKDKNVYVGMQMQGPLSFMCSFGMPGEEKNMNAFGFSYHVNSVVNVSQMDETFARIAYLGLGYTADSILHFRDVQLSDINPSAKAMAWADYGITYSRVVYNEGEHFIKAGGTLKLLQGIAGGYVYVKNLKYRWDNYDTLSLFQSEAQYAYSEGMVSSKGYSADNISDFIRFENEITAAKEMDCSMSSFYSITSKYLNLHKNGGECTWSGFSVLWSSFSGKLR